MARSGEIGGPPPLSNSGVGGMAQPLNKAELETASLRTAGPTAHFSWSGLTSSTAHFHWPGLGPPHTIASILLANNYLVAAPCRRPPY